MSQYSFFRILLTCGLLFGTSVGIANAQDNSRSERFFGYLDRDKDGRLSSEEARRMPSSIREAFERADFSLDRGISKDDFIREMPRVMEEMQRRREEERNRDRSRDDDRRREEPRREESRRDDDRRSSRGYTYSPRRRPKITMDIPSKFEDGDTDEDGQIGLYEWRQWKPEEEKYHFPVYDINRDGFLTPRELSNPPSREEIDNYLASIGAPPQPAGRRPSRPSSGSQTPSLNPTAQANKPVPIGDQPKPATAKQPQPKPAEQDATTKTAKLFFSQMDVDKSGQLTPDEWERSRRLKPKFEEVGIDLSKPMNLEQFTDAYRQAYGET
ncbi:MAG: hypothetical protein HUJ26_10745 [Planctomycetaceae bacterium]|nr:hypothetical protein [Planctomycetaceae bacterium]